MNLVKAVALTLPLALVGCGEPKLDGSSEEAMKASVAKVAASLDGQKKTDFQEAIQVVAFSQVDFKAMLSGKQSSESLVSGMASTLNGKTADEVIAQAEMIKVERAAREKAQALDEIAELEAEVAVAAAAKLELAKFEVVKSRFYQREKEYSYRKEPIIELSLKNGTAHAISRAYFKGTVSSPGRSVPWIVEDFNYAVPGGIEPGESADLALAPNMFSDWGKVEAPVDALFTVEVVKLDGPDGEVLFDAAGLSERKQERLAKLKKQYPSI